MLYRESSTLLDLTHHGNTALEISMRVFLERCDRGRKAYCGCGDTPRLPGLNEKKACRTQGCLVSPPCCHARSPQNSVRINPLPVSSQGISSPQEVTNIMNTI